MKVVVNDIQESLHISAQICSLLEGIGDFLLRMEGVAEVYEVSITLVDDDYIHELNYNYLGRDYATDVLAFNLNGDHEDREEIALEEEILGDVIISVERAQEQSELYGHSFEREVAFLAVHGILHLLGYDHETKDKEEEMKEKQELVLREFNLEMDNNGKKQNER